MRPARTSRKGDDALVRIEPCSGWRRTIEFAESEARGLARAHDRIGHPVGAEWSSRMSTKR